MQHEDDSKQASKIQARVGGPTLTLIIIVITPLLPEFKVQSHACTTYCTLACIHVTLLATEEVRADLACKQGLLDCDELLRLGSEAAVSLKGFSSS
jgi:hypothetical protein